jgi:predicted CoA-binding protein
MTSTRAIQRFLAPPAIAVVGASRNRHKFGNAACRILRDKGYRIYQINRHATTIDEHECFPRIGDVPEKVESVLIVVPSREALDVIREAAAAGARHVWLQQGAESDAAIELATSLGLDVVAGECVLMFANPSGIHRLHRGLRKLIGGVTTTTTT